MTNRNNATESRTGLRARLIADLDLESLPERLDDQQLAMVRRIAEAPLPSLPPCDPMALTASLRVMVAVLPRQASDELDGELFVQAYLRQLGDQPADAITYLVDQACRQCRWFPTIAECLEILSGWRRCDADTLRQRKAWEIANREESARRPAPQAVEPWQPTPSELERIKAEIAAKFPSNRS